MAADENGLAHVEVLRGWIAVQRGRYAEAIARARPHTRAEHEGLRGRALRTIGVAYLNMGKVRIALKYLGRAVALFRAAGLVSALSHLLEDMHLAYHRLGMLNEAGECLQEVVALRRRLEGPSALARALNNLGYYYHQRSDYEQALATLEEGLSLIAGLLDHRTEGLLLVSYGDVKRDLGLFRDAESLYRKALEVVPGDADPGLNAIALTSLSTLRRWQGRHDDAILLAEQALTTARERRLRFETGWAQAALSIAQLMTCQAGEGWEQLREAREGLAGIGARYELVAVLGWSAHAALLDGRVQEADAWLAEALALTRDLGSAQPVAAEASRDPRLAELIRDRHPRTILAADLDKLRQARRAHREAGEPLNGRPMGQTYSLRVFSFGQEMVERNGQRIPASAWRSALAKHLFLRLLFEGESGREAIAVEYWPDASQEQIRNNFHTLLHRARSALGPDVIAFHEPTGQYGLSPNITVWCDALEFERLMAQARTLPRLDPRAEDLYRKSAALYAGDFLPGIDADWIDARREALREAYLEALIGLGRCSSAREDYREAIGAFRRALAVDPYREDIHREIMACYAGSGQRSQAYRHFMGMKQQLRADLGIEPARETVALLNRLLG